MKINDQQTETTVTSLSVPNLSIGSVYNITVYSQDSDNRNGNISELLTITWEGKLYDIYIYYNNYLYCSGNTVPLPVTALSWNIIEIDDIIITLTWEVI